MSYSAHCSIFENVKLDHALKQSVAIDDLLPPVLSLSCISLENLKYFNPLSKFISVKIVS